MTDTQKLINEIACTKLNYQSWLKDRYRKPSHFKSISEIIEDLNFRIRKKDNSINNNSKIFLNSDD
ncbi:MAG: hypothetical protein PHS65_08215 [Arcobacteraceae bacterium]|nr:hypothetical protein [Arcobacteraceae bacterium]MDD3602337.1 hypothetical protein [Sulfurovum sp.]